MPTAHATLAQVVQRVDPHAVLQDVWSLKGGISAQMTGLAVITAAGQPAKWVLRCPAAHTLAQDPHAAAHEAAVLETVATAGIPAPRVLLVDESRHLLPTPYLVLDYIEGAAVFTPSRGAAVATAVATLLASLHRAAIDTRPLAFLPRAHQLVKSPQRPLDAALGEARIRTVLASASPPSGPTHLLHGDCWPGNLLWRDDRLAALVDWEDAMLGDPLADLAISRLDLLWIFGPAAMHTVTTTYADMTGHDLAALPRWDLAAALRPCGNLAEWAAQWPALGRPDINVATMAAAHAQFVDQALAQIER